MFVVDEDKVYLDDHIQFTMMSVESLTYFRQTMAVLCCLFGLPGNLLTIIVCTKALYLRTMHLQRKMFNLYLVQISFLGKRMRKYKVRTSYLVSRVSYETHNRTSANQI